MVGWHVVLLALFEGQGGGACGGGLGSACGLGRGGVGGARLRGQRACWRGGGLGPGEVDHLGYLASADDVAWVEVGQQPGGNTGIVHEPTSIAADNVARCKALDVVVEGVTGRHILERLIANRLIEVECDCHHFGELTTAYGVTGTEVWVAVGVARLFGTTTRIAGDDATICHSLYVQVEGVVGRDILEGLACHVFVEACGQRYDFGYLPPGSRIIGLEARNMGGAGARGSGIVACYDAKVVEVEYVLVEVVAGADVGEALARAAWWNRGECGRTGVRSIVLYECGRRAAYFVPYNPSVSAQCRHPVDIFV